MTNTVCLLTNIPGFATVKYKIDYAFDPVGNVTNRLITGLQGMSGTITTRYQYDVMNRLTNVVQLTNGTATASAWYAYDAAGRLWKKGYGNGDVVTHAYDTESRLLSLGITNNATPVWWSTYLWDDGGNILAITNGGGANVLVSLYGYDRAGQLTNEVVLTNGLAGGETNAWVYDEAGNWLNAPGGSKWLYNADNEMVARAPSGTPSVPSPTSFTLTGEVEPGPQSNKWFNTWAEYQGVQGRVSTNDGTFALPGISIDQWGYNYLDVTVRDVSGNTAQQRRTVVKGVTNALETFHYDGNGNLTNWTCGTTNWVYEWDWADRLTKVTSNGVTVLENWYDASSQRVAKQEVVNGQTQYTFFVSDSWNIVGAGNQSAQVLETFTRGAGLTGDIGTLVAVTHHAGSSSNGTFYAHHNHRGDVNLTRSSTTTVGTLAYSAFGALTSRIGSDVCRFKFSSKERDAATGFSYYGYRFYAPRWQRWPNHDPIAERGGLNLYGFVHNNPIFKLDSHGLKLWKCTRQAKIPIIGSGGGQHVYLWDDRGEGASCGRGGGLRGRGVDQTKNKEDLGPNGGHDCEPIENSDGMEQVVMDCCMKSKTLLNDCHDWLDDCLKGSGLDNPDIYGRWKAPGAGIFRRHVKDIEAALGD